MKDLYNNITLLSGHDPIQGGDGTAPAAVAFDLIGYESAVFVWWVGLEGSTLSGTNYWNLKMEHADDNGSGAAGTYTNVAAADVQGATPASGIVVTVDDPAEDNKIYKIGYVGGKRFVRCTIAETGTGPNLPQALMVIKGHPALAPVA
jgi:hypothetical protein